MSNNNKNSRISDFLEKIIVNTGVGKIRQKYSKFEENILPEIVKELSLITGQKPIYTKAKKSIAGFKIREGEVVGLKITLRRKKMEDFFNRLINLVIPQIRDFNGIALKSINPKGGLTIGIREQFVFPEIDSDKSKVNFGLEATFIPKEKNRDKAIEIYKKIGVPLKTKSEK